MTADMGYGHERASHALTDLAYGDPIVSNNYPGIPERGKKLWRETRVLYEAFSRFKSVPILGEIAWSLFDNMQEIEPHFSSAGIRRRLFRLSGRHLSGHDGC